MAGAFFFQPLLSFFPVKDSSLPLWRIDTAGGEEEEEAGGGGSKTLSRR